MFKFPLPSQSPVQVPLPSQSPAMPAQVLKIQVPSTEVQVLVETQVHTAKAQGSAEVLGSAEAQGFY